MHVSDADPDAFDEFFGIIYFQPVFQVVDSFWSEILRVRDVSEFFLFQYDKIIFNFWFFTIYVIVCTFIIHFPENLFRQISVKLVKINRIDVNCFFGD